ncbi:MAG: phosphoribosylglycinamide formyltransferase [Bacteroidetes bacterium]|nr:phosphoribosylglycinamide formyltransferase [Bacteroidota bacterium]
MLKIAVFVSGKGSNLLSLIDSTDKYRNSYRVDVVVSNKVDCSAFEIAEKFGIKKICVSEANRNSCSTYDELSDYLVNNNIDLIVLAGFLKKIPEKFVDKFENKIINIHPALLPSFGGFGMYGMNVHQAVFEKSCKVSGVTVHFVNSDYDKGIIIAQKAVDISFACSPREIAELVLKEEHKLLPMVVDRIARNKIRIANNRVCLVN